MLKRDGAVSSSYVVKNDRKVTEFLDSDYTFLNDRLARHYGVAGVSAVSEFQPGASSPTGIAAVCFHAGQRPHRHVQPDADLAGQARQVGARKHPRRSPPPPPAPDVPELEATPSEGVASAMQLEQHRANPSLRNGCHAKMDPLGFGLENYDGIGGWRTTDKAAKLDSSGILPDGAKFDGPSELRKVLLGKSELFRRCLSEKLLTFALGRGLEYYDKCVLDELSAKLKTADDQFSALILAIAQSDPFTKRQSKRSD